MPIARTLTAQTRMRQKRQCAPRHTKTASAAKSAIPPPGAKSQVRQNRQRCSISRTYNSHQRQKRQWLLLITCKMTTAAKSAIPPHVGVSPTCAGRTRERREAAPG